MSNTNKKENSYNTNKDNYNILNKTKNKSIPNLENVSDDINRLLNLKKIIK